MKKKENNIILFGIAITVLASAGFTVSQGTVFSEADKYETPKSVIEEPKEDLELEENENEEIDEEDAQKLNEEETDNENKIVNMESDVKEKEESKKEETTSNKKAIYITK